MTTHGVIMSPERMQPFFVHLFQGRPFVIAFLAVIRQHHCMLVFAPDAKRSLAKIASGVWARQGSIVRQNNGLSVCAFDHCRNHIALHKLIFTSGKIFVMCGMIERIQAVCTTRSGRQGQHAVSTVEI